jgi:hypothetical protein
VEAGAAELTLKAFEVVVSIVLGSVVLLVILGCFVVDAEADVNMFKCMLGYRLL